jgi:hypothetical protein
MLFFPDVRGFEAIHFRSVDFIPRCFDSSYFDMCDGVTRVVRPWHWIVEQEERVSYLGYDNGFLAKITVIKFRILFEDTSPYIT